MAVLMALKDMESDHSLISPPSPGMIPASDSQESRVTEANNWKITASSPNDPQYTKVI